MGRVPVDTWGVTHYAVVGGRCVLMITASIRFSSGCGMLGCGLYCCSHVQNLWCVWCACVHACTCTLYMCIYIHVYISICAHVRTQNICACILVCSYVCVYGMCVSYFVVHLCLSSLPAKESETHNDKSPLTPRCPSQLQLLLQRPHQRINRRVVHSMHWSVHD